MRRRDFITLVGAAAVAWPLTARAQQPAIPVIGFLNPRSATDTVGLTAAFRQALNEVGFVDGRNVAIEYRWASNQVDQLPALAAELVGRPAAVIAAFSTVGALARQEGNNDDPDRVLDRRRPGEGRYCRKPRPAGRQHHRRVVRQRHAWDEAISAPACARTHGRSDRHADGPKQP